MEKKTALKIIQLANKRYGKLGELKTANYVIKYYLKYTLKNFDSVNPDNRKFKAIAYIKNIRMVGYKKFLDIRDVNQWRVQSALRHFKRNIDLCNIYDNLNNFGVEIEDCSTDRIAVSLASPSKKFLSQLKSD